MSNRDALLDAALTCIKEKGYAQTTARDLVEVSGTNLGAIGYHFGSKEKLLNEAIYRGFAEWMEGIAARALPPSAGDFWSALELSIRGVLESLESQRPLCVAFVEALAQAERSQELRDQFAAGYERYRRGVAAHLQAASQPPDARALAQATLIVALADGLLIQWLLDPNSLPSAAELTESLRSALGEATPSPK